MRFPLSGVLSRDGSSRSWHCLRLRECELTDFAVDLLILAVVCDFLAVVVVLSALASSFFEFIIVRLFVVGAISASDLRRVDCFVFGIMLRVVWWVRIDCVFPASFPGPSVTRSSIGIFFRDE